MVRGGGRGGPGGLPAPGVQRSARPRDSFSDSPSAALFHSDQRFQTNNLKPVNEQPVSVCLSICLVVKRLGEAFVRLIQFSMSHDQPRPNERTNRGPFFVYVFSKVNHKYVKMYFITSKTTKPWSKKLSLFQKELIQKYVQFTSVLKRDNHLYKGNIVTKDHVNKRFSLSNKLL